MDGALKTKGIIYLNVGDFVLVCPPLSKFLATRLIVHLSKCWRGTCSCVGMLKG